MKTPYAPLKLYRRLIGLAGCALLVLASAAGTRAQSTDIGFPTPVRADEIGGTIAPRDVGDPRLTRYFYSFTGTPGDLIVTVEGRNLEGDVDVFTAGALRPLAKISLYAGGTASGGSQTIFLRTRQSLILRVEARTPNDAEGSFRVRFGGAFEPVSGDIPDPQPVAPAVSSTGKGRRVTSTGARIDEPEPAATATPEPETPTPATEPPTPAGTPATTTAEAERPAPSGRRTSRTTRTRTPRRTRTRPAPSARRTTPAEPQPAPAPVVEPMSGPRLIIETRDGMRVERYMTTVRRVTVERGLLVVITTDGKVERHPMSSVLRMAIEP